MRILRISDDIASGLVDILIPLKLCIYSLAAFRREIIYSLSIAVKLPPKKAISDRDASIPPEFSAVSTVLLTSSDVVGDILPVILCWSQKLHLLGHPAKGTKIETLERLIAHQLQSFSGSLLLCFLLAFSAAFSDGI